MQATWSGRVRQWRTTLIILALIVLAGVAWGIKLYHDKHAIKFPPAVKSTEQKYHYLANQGNYGAAEGVLSGALKTAKTKEDKANIYFEQSGVAIQFKHYEDAKKYADKALEVDPGYSDAYAAEAFVATAQGDKTAAKKYWQQAIAHLDPNRPAANIIKRDYQTNLDSL